jgi:RIO-like serine/threonine protein kinase
MHTLQQLLSGELQGIKELKISENLTAFPMEILNLAESLEILDLSNNQLCEIPQEINRLKKLKIAFFSNNNFTKVPSAFRECENLTMLGFKANKIEEFAEDILPLGISWLILTDNKLKKLPDSIGKLTKLQKFPLAGNELTELPQTMKECKNLELIRLSANKLQELPSWLLQLPKLSWLAFSGNPCSVSPKIVHKEISYKDLQIGELLGNGASGEIFKGSCEELQQNVAIKLFKGAITSDGYAEDEMNACLSMGEHPNLIKVLAKIKEPERLGLLLECIPTSYSNLGSPPNFETCTRDTYKESQIFTLETINAVAKSIASVAAHLHKKNLMHGDLYAHNILINEESVCYLGDFGAASFYDANNNSYEKIEVRAFGCLLDDMLSRSPIKENELYNSLKNLRERCLNEDVQSRPLFSQMKFK